MDLAMRIFNLTIGYPKEEKYSLTDQIRRSSRSVSANIREGYAKKQYKNVFIRHLIDSLGSSEETITWLEFSKRCNYISDTEFESLSHEYKSLSSMLAGLIKNWK